MKKITLFIASLFIVLVLKAQENTNYGTDAGNSGTYNTSLGYKAGDVVTNHYNTFIGYMSGALNTSGYSNNFLGYKAGTANLNGYHNSFYGYASGIKQTEGNYNSFFGNYSGLNNLSGDNNMYMGYSAGTMNVEGNNNTFLGNSAGYLNTGSNNVFLGYNAGYNELGSNKLYIDNSNTTTPLIYGDFSTDVVNINGKLGVGTNSPLSKFSISGPLNNYSWAVEGSNGWGDFSITNGTYGLAVGVACVGAGAGDVFLWTKGGSQKLYFGNPTDGVTMVLANGNVGIGNIIPQSKLDVNGDIYINSGIDDNHIYWGGHNMTFGTKQGEYANNIFSLRPGGSTTDKLYSEFNMYVANSPSSHELKVKISTADVSYFNGGNVLIGKTTQTVTGATKYKLEVEGAIRANEVVINADGADFVFAPTYKLRPLAEVESFIKQNQHLPEIAPAKDMQNNGVNISELQIQLLQKVEELTLYTIEQDKKMKNQEIVNQQLLNEINELKNLIKK